MSDKLIRIVTLCRHGEERPHGRGCGHGFQVHYVCHNRVQGCPGGSTVDLTRLQVQSALDAVIDNLMPEGERLVIDLEAVLELAGDFK